MVGLRIGIVGVGAMGEPMAQCLRRAGFEVIACAHRNPEPLERLSKEGVRRARDPAGVAAQSDVLITMVPDAPQVEEAIFAEQGLLAGAEKPTYFIDMSTISPVASRRFAERLTREGHFFMDSPVSGGPARAKEGTLTLMVGACDADFARMEPVLRAMGVPHHVGPVGMGETVKLVNQILIANIMIANAEALTFAKRSGADIGVVREVIASATGSNYLLEKWLPTTWFAGSFERGFAMDLLRKDLAAALDTARSFTLPLPASSLAYQVYTAASAQGNGSRDYTAVATLYERIATE
ncbi:MAG: NAD(P)-dependent oxidoreductase [Candidatus Eremiobacteraeota bacterium]|nr:NAD(P)-dependent oxidoreductase [Candidatus Eremiobacteraeota bacterium]